LGRDLDIIPQQSETETWHSYKDSRSSDHAHHNPPHNIQKMKYTAAVLAAAVAPAVLAQSSASAAIASGVSAVASGASAASSAVARGTSSAPAPSGSAAANETAPDAYLQQVVAALT